MNDMDSNKAASLPSRERGLKFMSRTCGIGDGCVAPFAGAWIEIDRDELLDRARVGRSLRGSVD